MTVNALTPISIKIDYDNLLASRLDKMSLREAMQYEYKYNFIDQDVEKVYSLVKEIFSKISVPNDNGLEFLRNRYIHFYGHDLLMKKYDMAYREWLNAINTFSYDIFMFILNFYTNSDINSLIDKKIKEFLENYGVLEKKLKGIQQRVLIELKKINELVHYRPIFR